MRRFYRIASIVLVLVIMGSQIAFASGSGGYSRTKPLKVSFGKLGNDSEFDNQRHLFSDLMEKVKEYSNARLLLNYITNGQLGGEPNMLTGDCGDLDIATLSEGNFSGVP